MGKVRDKLEHVVLCVVLIVALPFAPLMYAWHTIRAARERRDMARYQAVTAIAPDESGYRAGNVYRLTLAGGGELRIDTERVQHATWVSWGDGINGSRSEHGLCLDHEVRIRFTEWVTEYRALIDSLRTRGLLPRYATERAHPDDPASYLLMMAMLGGVIDAVVLALLLGSRC